MDDHTSGPRAIDGPGLPKRRRAIFALLGLAAMALLAAACGGGSKGPGVASARATTTVAPPSRAATSTAPPGSSTAPHSSPATTGAPSGSSGSGSPGEASQSEELQLSQCMRSHGVPNFPDPSAEGMLQAIAAAGIDTQSPAYHAALQACRQYTQSGNVTPAQRAAANAKGLEFSQCMRAHGVPDFPDPSTGPLGEQVMDLRGLGMDLNSPTFQAANQACQKLVPGSK